MKKKIATLMVTVAMAGVLFAGPALARESYYHHDVHRWEIQHPRQIYVYRPMYGPAYSYNRMMPRPAHWIFIGGHWRWVRG